MGLSTNCLAAKQWQMLVLRALSAGGHDGDWEAASAAALKH